MIDEIANLIRKHVRFERHTGRAPGLYMRGEEEAAEAILDLVHAIHQFGLPCGKVTMDGSAPAADSLRDEGDDA